MCGIIGSTGKKNVTPFLLDGLRALEYRGYDSAGLYVAGRGALKSAGKVSELAKAVPATFSGAAGIAHTRWATHGAPTEQNAHPHSDSSGTVWLVHNGIIENHAELRSELALRGTAFVSDTDTEVLAQLIGAQYVGARSLEEAVAMALDRVRGTYGIAVMSTREPGKIVGARLGSPLLVGIGTDSLYLASDATPLLTRTRDVIYLDDGESVTLDTTYRITDRAGTQIEKQVHHLDWDAEAAQKKGHEHFMLKEMLEIPEVIERALGADVDAILPSVQNARQLLITGCGSAYYAGLVGELLFEEIAGIPVEVVIGSELRYRRATADPHDTVLIAISQSGETLDTLEALKEARRQGIQTISIVNVVGSTIARESDVCIYNHAGPEICVASTKAFISQLTVLACTAVALSRERGMSRADEKRAIEELATLPAKVRAILASRADIEAIAKKYVDARDAFYLGRKFQCPIAFEGAIKLKEIAYVHAEGYGAGEMKHGPIALIDDRFPSIVLAPRDSMYEKTKSNIQEIRARGGKIIAVTTEDGRADIAPLADDTIAVPQTLEGFLPILTTIPLQLFAYYSARERGLPIDQPRNLAKSVTVE